MSQPDIRVTMFLPPDDTLRVWQLRGELRPTMRWHEMMHEDHATAFTVAKIARLDLLADVRQSLDRAMREGRTFEAWQGDLVPELQKAGWWGRVVNAGLTGTDQPVIVNERRLRTIFHTNVRMSQASAAWLKVQAEKDRFPYLRYLSDHFRKHPRLDHKSWHGIILPVNHPWWQTHFPPNGWGCLCDYEQVSEARMRRKGWKVSEPPDDGPPRDFLAAGRAKPVKVPRGIHPGFGYNPGTAHLQAVADKANASVDRAVEAGLVKAARQTVEDIVADPAFAQFRALPDQPFPVQILELDQAQALGSASQVVRFSGASASKQTTRHPELLDADYRRLPALIREPQHIERQSDGRIAFYRAFEGRWYRAAIKVTSASDELFLLHFQRVRESEMARLLRKRPMIAGWAALIASWLGAR